LVGRGRLLIELVVDELLGLTLEDDTLLAGILLDACELLLLSEDIWLLVAAELSVELLAILLAGILLVEIGAELTDDLATELIEEAIELPGFRLDEDRLLLAILLDARELMLDEEIALLMAVELGAELFTELLAGLLLDELALRELAIEEPIRLELTCDVLVELAANELAAALLLLNKLMLTLA
jgi:hypothetical protein